MAIMLTEREPVLSNSRDHHPEVRAAQARGIYAAPGGSQSYALLRKRKVRNDSSLGSSGHGLAHLAFAPIPRPKSCLLSSGPTSHRLAS